MEAKLTEADVTFDTVFTKRASHAPELAEQAIAEGIRHLVAVGGDGTAHEVANGILSQQHCPSEEVTFTLLPIGTGNDWVKTHRIPKNFQTWLSYFLEGKTAFQDVGSLRYRNDQRDSQRFFINVAGLSYDGYVVKQSAEQSMKHSSSLFYLWAMTRWLFGFKIPPAHIFFDGKKVDGKFYTINIGICRYSGGGMQLVPQALPDDGLLALTYAGKISKLEVLLISPIFYLGKIGWHPKVSTFQVENVKVVAASDMPVYLEADGEYLGEAPVEVEILKKKLKIVVPG